jgi:3-oxoacyl-[acyl-carrier-protein] synthase-3
MDFNTACSGFGTSMKMIGALLKDEPNQKIGLGICDRPSTRSDFADRGSCILFGDSAAFFCIENSSKVSGFEILDVTEL